ncbi:MAG: HPr family phosphocarrier protein [bacterium]|nr:HPr family phosphocarrier protein [bacterium]
MAKVSRPVKVLNELGLHLRPAGILVKVANRYKSEITLEKDGEKVNAKSIMGVMMLGAEPNSTVVISAEGDDAEAAVAALEELFTTQFAELSNDKTVGI